jgi:hypothetical protein
MSALRGYFGLGDHLLLAFERGFVFVVENGASTQRSGIDAGPEPPQTTAAFQITTSNILKSTRYRSDLMLI